MPVIKKTIAVWVAILWLFPGLLGGAAAQERFCAAGTVSIKTQYLKYGTYAELSEDIVVPSKQLHWRIQCKNMKTGRQIIFLLNGETEFCTLNLPSREGGIIRLLNNKKKLVEQSSPSFLPPTGYPAPCRILDFNRIWGSDTFEVVKNAGGRKFRRRYSIIEREVGFDTAQKSQWIQSGVDVNENDRLILYTVYDLNDRFMFKQLWIKGDDSWWVYEETPNSKSWRE